MGVLQHYFALLLPDSTAQTNEMVAITTVSRPHLSKPANRRRLSAHRGRATQVTQGEKNRKEEKKKNSGPCYGVRLKQTRISTLHYQLNQYLWIEHTQVLRQVESLTANSSVAPSENNLPLFSLSVYLNWVSSPFVRSPYHLEKGEPSCYFYFNLCSNCSFYPCGPWWLRTVILWWCSLGQQLVQMGVNWVRMRGK